MNRCATAAILDLAAILDFLGGRKSRFQWSDLGGVLYMYYWATNKQFKVETALLQFLSNLDYKNSFVYWTSNKV